MGDILLKLARYYKKTVFLILIYIRESAVGCKLKNLYIDAYYHIKELRVIMQFQL